MKEYLLQLSSKQIFMYFGTLVGIVLVIIFISYSLKESEQTSPPVSQSSEPGRVYVKDLDKLGSAISPEAINMIEMSLYSNVNQGRKDLYTGTIQPNSYTTKLSYMPSGNIQIKYLRVNVEPIKMTYLVSIREHQGARSVNITCAAKKFQMDQSIICRESIWI